MAKEIARWLAAVPIGLGCGGLVWVAFLWIPWLPELPLVPTLGAWLGLSFLLAWIGLPIVADPNWLPETPRARSYDRLRRRALAWSQRPRNVALEEALGWGGLGASLLAMGLVSSIFLIGSFAASSGVGIRIVCFGGALASALGAWLRGGRLGRVLAVVLALLTLATWSVFELA